MKTRPINSSSRRPPTYTVGDPVTQWAQEVAAGDIIAGPHVRNAAKRHLHDLEHGPSRGLRWDVDAANYAIDFFEIVLKLNGGQFEGLPFLLHPSQKFRVGSLFGWKRGDNTRRFRRFFDEEAKGNGKSPLLAGIGMLCLVADGEDRAEIYAAASKKDQAMVLFRDAVAMWQQSPDLNNKLKPLGGNPVWNLAYTERGGFFRPISSEDGQSGPRPSCALCDEVHEHRNGNMIEMLERGFKWRRQPLLCMATNSGSDRNSVCWEEHQHAIRVAAGTREPDAEFTFVGDVIDDSTFSFVCSLDPGDDPLNDPSCWAKANPLLGVTVQPDYLAGVARQAKDIPGKMNNILRLHFCVWTDAEQAWMSRPVLESCLSGFDPNDYTGEKAYVGLDLSATQDLAAMAIVVPTGRRASDNQTTYAGWVEVWTPGDTVNERALRDNAPYDLWVRDGWLEAPPGKRVRFDFMAARLAEISGLYDIQLVAYDTYGFGKAFEPEMDELGLTLPIAEHPQGGKKKGKDHGLWMPGSKMLLENLMLEGRIMLRKSPVLISAIMSASIEEDPFGNAWFSKRRALSRIDPLVALAMAVGATTSVADNAPVYDIAFL